MIVVCAAEGHNIDLRDDSDAALIEAPQRPALAYLAFDDAGAASLTCMHVRMA